MNPIKSSSKFCNKVIKNTLKINAQIYKPTYTLTSNIYSLETCANQILQLSKITYPLPNINLPIQQMIKDINTTNIETINSIVKIIYKNLFTNLNQLSALNLNLNQTFLSNELTESIYSFTDSFKEFCNENNIVDNDVENCVKSIDSTKEIFENNKLSKSDILNIINIVVTLLFFVYGLYSDTQNNISNEHMTKTIQQNTEANIKLTKELEKLNSNLKKLSSEY